MASLSVGGSISITGDISTLNVTGARPPALVERSLGFAAGRLAAGYWLLLLKQVPGIDDFIFGGTTLRSGGKLGLPGKSAAEDAARISVDAQMREEYGPADYLAHKKGAIGRSGFVYGPNRLMKIIPETSHDSNLASFDQYPMGGGHLQWKLIVPKPFFVAMRVRPDGMATTPTMDVQLVHGAPMDLYANRSKLIRYLETVTPPA
jgi:hypothetical protein